MLLHHKYVQQVRIEISAKRVVSFVARTEANLLFFLSIALESIKLEESLAKCPECVI